MIRSLRHPAFLRKSSRSFRLFQVARKSSLAVKEADQESDQGEQQFGSVPYGNEYGPGPSRLPYSPQSPDRRSTFGEERRPFPSRSSHISKIRSPSKPNQPNSLYRVSTPRHSSSPSVILLDSPLSPSVQTSVINKRRSTRHTAAILRKVILEADRLYRSGASNQFLFSNPDYCEQLAQRVCGHSLFRCSRLEQHSVIHALIACRQRFTPWTLITNCIRSGRQHNPQQRTLFAFKTLQSLFHRQGIAARKTIAAMSTDLSHSSARPSRPFRVIPNTNPTLEEQAAPPYSPTLSAMCDLLLELSNIRNRRPEEIYLATLRQCWLEGRPDIAARVYVAMVEEWITEGRIAEGASSDDFSEASAPPRDPKVRSEREQKNVWLSLWWKGIRTWTLPGETLGPYQRLALWHPRRLALKEKLRSFPYPSPASPPTLVPAPEEWLLFFVLDRMELDPETASPAAFAASMRACAMLSNTLLTRTLPFLSKARLYEKLCETPAFPPVYPDNMLEEPPRREKWAYQAYTHIHIALQSIMWSPPTPSRFTAYIAAVETAKMNGESLPAPPPELYMLPPLSFRSCLRLIQYGFEHLRRPEMVQKIINFLSEQNQISRPALNLLYRLSSLVRNNEIAQQVENLIFGKTSLAKDLPFPQPTPAEVSNPSTPDAKKWRRATRVGESKLSIKRIRDDVEPNQASVLHLIKHLTATSQFVRLEALTYELLPFLQFNKTMTSSEVEMKADQLQLPKTYIYRPRPQNLSAWVYNGLLNGLEKGGHVSLVMRVWRRALAAERQDIRAWELSHGTQPDARTNRLGIEEFTVMLRLWHRVRKHDYGMEDVTPYQNDWVCKTARGLPRDEAASIQQWELYLSARRRWQRAVQQGHDPRNLRPDRHFYDALLKAKSKDWGLDSSVDQKAIGSIASKQIAMVLHDMMSLGLPTPPGLWYRLGRPMPVEQADLAWKEAIYQGYSGIRTHWEEDILTDGFTGLRVESTKSLSHRETLYNRTALRVARLSWGKEKPSVRLKVGSLTGVLKRGRAVKSRRTQSRTVGLRRRRTPQLRRIQSQTRT